MSLTINLNTGASVNGGTAIGLMTAAGNPWSVPDALAKELVNRGIASAVGWPVTPAFKSDLARSNRSIAPALSRFNTALAATLAGTAETKIAIVGDSKTVGMWGTGVLTRGNRLVSVPAILAALLAGAGVPATSASSFGIGSVDTTTLYAGYDPRVSASSANWNVTGNSSISGTSFYNTTNEASSLNFAFEETINQVDIYTLLSAGGVTVTVTVDGGSTVFGNIATAGGLTFQKSTVNLPLGVHTVNINRPVGAGGVVVAGIVARNTLAPKVQVFNWGMNGAISSTHLDISNSYSIGQLMAIVPVNLAILRLGTNDMLNALTVGPVGTAGTLLYNIQAHINRFNAAGADIIGCIPEPVSVTYNANSTLANQQAAYFAMRQLYQQNGVPVVDEFALYGDYTAGVAAGYFGATQDLVHPYSTGYMASAKQILSMLGLNL